MNASRSAGRVAPSHLRLVSPLEKTPEIKKPHVDHVVRNTKPGKPKRCRRNPDLEPPRPGAPRHVLEVHRTFCENTTRTFPIRIAGVNGVPSDMPVVCAIRTCGWAVVVFTVSEAEAIARLFESWHGGPLPTLPVDEQPHRRRYMGDCERWTKTAWALARHAVRDEHRATREALKKGRTKS